MNKIKLKTPEKSQATENLVGYIYSLIIFHVHGTIRTAHTTHAAALKTTTHPKTRCRKLYAVTQHLLLLMMGLCTRNMSR